MTVCDTTSGVAADPDRCTVPVECSIFAQRAFDPRSSCWSGPASPCRGTGSSCFSTRLPGRRTCDRCALAAAAPPSKKVSPGRSPAEVLDADKPRTLRRYPHRPRPLLWPEKPPARRTGTPVGHGAAVPRWLSRHAPLSTWHQRDRSGPAAIAGMTGRDDLACLRLLERQPAAGDVERSPGFSVNSQGSLLPRVSAALAALASQKPGRRPRPCSNRPGPLEPVPPGLGGHLRRRPHRNRPAGEAKAIATRLAGAPSTGGTETELRSRPTTPNASLTAGRPVVGDFRPIRLPKTLDGRAQGDADRSNRVHFRPPKTTPGTVSRVRPVLGGCIVPRPLFGDFHLES